MEGEETLTKRERKKLRKQEKKEEERQEKQQNMFQKYGVIGAILVAAVAAWFLFIYRPGDGSEPEGNEQQAANVETVVAGDHKYGKEDSNVVLIEYGDFQCPACAAYAPVVSTVKEEFKDDVLFVFRHYPLRSIHRHAQIASQAAQAASLQASSGKCMMCFLRLRIPGVLYEAL